MERLKCRDCLSTICSCQLAEFEGGQTGNECEWMSTGKEAAGYTNGTGQWYSNCVFWSLGFLEGSFRGWHEGEGGEEEIEQEAIFSQKCCFLYLSSTKYWTGTMGIGMGLYAFLERWLKEGLVSGNSVNKNNYKRSRGIFIPYLQERRDNTETEDIYFCRYRLFNPNM